MVDLGSASYFHWGDPVCVLQGRGCDQGCMYILYIHNVYVLYCRAANVKENFCLGSGNGRYLRVNEWGWKSGVLEK